MILRISIILLLLTHLVGCQRTVVKPVNTFDATATQYALAKGNSTITGQAFAKTVGGDIKLAAGNKIMLLPLTPYLEELLKLKANKGALTDIDANPDVINYKRETIADASGRFKFENLKTGKYYLETDISWGVPNVQCVKNLGCYNTTQTTGGTLTGLAVITQDRQTIEVILQ